MKLMAIFDKLVKVGSNYQLITMEERNSACRDQAELPCTLGQVTRNPIIIVPKQLEKNPASAMLTL